ncbi:MAG: conserved rane protein of unknown function [Ilumatobacteraceae bacterium]|nr:conserved rane protein of unknown function [Ilumatobacteraceae bacterium]
MADPADEREDGDRDDRADPHDDLAPHDDRAPHDDHDSLIARIDELLSLRGLRHAEQSLVGRVIPAWRRQTPGEQRTAVTVAIVVAIALLLALPPRVENPPRLLLPGLALLMLIGLVVANPGRLERRSKWIRRASLALIALISLANAASGARLVIDLVRAEGIRNAGELLATGAAIWVTNIIVFSLWYWDTDRGGPVLRAAGERDRPDFLFPQMQLPELAGADWEPLYVDYLYLSFTNATAFSPTDVLPLSRWAKLVMMLQSMISIVVVALVIARAVNVLN